MGKPWISESDMDTLLDIANKQYNDIICFASKPNNHLCALVLGDIKKTEVRLLLSKTSRL